MNHYSQIKALLAERPRQATRHWVSAKEIRPTERGLPDQDGQRKIRNLADSGSISVTGEIGWDTTANDLAAAMNAVDGDVHIVVSSEGGEIYNGLDMYAMIRNRAETDAVTVEITSKAFSAASFFPMAASGIAMHASAEMMIHNAWTIVAGNKEELGEVQARLGQIDEILADIYAARTNQSVEQIQEWMEAETFMRAEEARDRGFVDAVIPLAGGGHKKKSQEKRKQRERQVAALKAQMVARNLTGKP